MRRNTYRTNNRRSGLANEYEASGVGMSWRVQGRDFETRFAASRGEGGGESEGQRPAVVSRNGGVRRSPVEQRARAIALPRRRLGRDRQGDLARALPAPLPDERRFAVKPRPGQDGPNRHVPVPPDVATLTPRRDRRRETGTHRRMSISGRCRPRIHTRATGRQADAGPRDRRPWSVREPWTRSRAQESSP